MKRAGVLLGSMRVEGVDFAYAQVPEGRGQHAHWFMGADKGGLRTAGGWEQGTLTETGADPTPAQIAARLARALENPPHDRRFNRATVHLLRTSVTQRKLASAVATNPEDAWGYEARVNVLLDEALEPLRKALGEIRLSIARRLDGDGTSYKALMLTDAQIQGALRFEKSRRWAAPLVLGTGDVDYLRDDDGILAHALELRGLHPAIARRLGPATVRFDMDCARTAAAVPIDWIPGPDDDREWSGFRIVAAMLGVAPAALTSRYASLLAPVKGRWAEYVLKLAGDRGLDGEEMLAAAPTVREGARLSPLQDFARDAGDMMLTLDLWAGNLPIQADWDGESEENLPAMLLVGNRGLGALLEISRDWHADPAFHERHGNRAETSWEPILPDRVDEDTGISVEVLKGSVELAEEGARGLDREGRKGLWHCVGGDTYVEACESDRTRIVSLRKDGQRLSTAEIQLGELGGVRQHRGWKNGTPPPDAAAALARYVALPEVGAAARAAKTRIRPRTSRGHDPVDLEEMFERWRPYLAGEYRRMDIDELVEAISQPPGPTP